VNHKATLLPNGPVLAEGGSSVGNGIGVYLSTAEVYDPSGGTWMAAGSLTKARANHTAIMLPNGQVLVAGGAVGIGNSYISSVEVYDSANGLWTNTAALTHSTGNP